MTYSKSFFPARVVSDALNVSQKSVHRRAKREGWPRRQRGYRVEYAVPHGLLRACQGRTPIPSILYQPARIRELKRAAAVLGYALEIQRNPERGVEKALVATVRQFKHLMRFSVSALREWISADERSGLAGLQEHKLGRVGRKAARLEKILK